MNAITSKLRLSFLLLSAAFLDASGQQKGKIQSAKSTVSTAKANVSAKKNISAPQQSSQVQKTSQAKKQSASANSSTQSSQQVEQLMQTFIQAVGKITCSCGTSKKGEKVDPKSLCAHDQKHKETVDAALKAYEALHKATHQKQAEMSEADNNKVLPSVVKLFECKNIKNMAWHPKVKHSPSSQAPQPQTTSTASSTKK